MKIYAKTLHTLRLDLKEFYQAGLTFEQIAEALRSIDPQRTGGESLRCQRVGIEVAVPIPARAIPHVLCDIIEERLNSLVGEVLPNFDATISGRVMRILAEQLVLNEVRAEQLHETFEELGADSLDIVEIVMAVEDEFGVDVSDDEWRPMRTPHQLILWLQKTLP
jgi:acyl carrier protein